VIQDVKQGVVKQRNPKGQTSAVRNERLSLLASIVESSDDAIIAKNLDGIITSWNPAAEKMYGYSSQEIVGKSIQVITHPDGADQMAAILDSIREGRRTEHYETVRVRKDGVSLPVSLTVSPIHNAEGVIIGASTIARDVTGQMQAFDAARSMIESSLDSLVSISPEGKITDVNEALIKVTGAARQELIGAEFSEYFTEPDKAEEIYQKVFAEGMAVDYPLTIRHRDGTLTDVLYNASVYRDAEAKVLGVFAAARDVTKQKQAFDAARSMIEASLDSLVSISPEGKITDVNEALIKVTGVARQELIGAEFSEYFTEPDKAEEIYQLVFKEGMAVDYPLTIRHRDGTLTEVLYNASVYRDVEGRVLGVFAAARDVTEQTQAFDAARSMIESSLDSLVSISPEGKITDVNEALIKVTGVARQELIGTDFSGYFTEPDKAEAIYQLVFKDGMAVDYPLTIRHPDGTLTDVLYNASVYRDVEGKVLGVFAAARDVTEQKQAFESARSMIESSLDSLVSISPEGKITDVNEALIKVTGVARQRLIGTDFSGYFTEPDKAEAIYQLVFKEGMAVDYPLTIRHPDGTLTDVLYNASVYRDVEGKVLGVFAAARDVTEQKQAFESARSMIESSLDSLVSISPEGKITDVNEALIKVTGAARQELIGAEFSEYFTEPDKAEEIYQKVFAEGMAVDYPLTIRNRDGALTEVLYNASVYRDAEGTVLGVFAAARDVTLQKQAQAEIAEQLAKELERLAELERFQRLTVGRELKMIELKREIEYLRTLVPADADESG
jgi:PAS domain S-box-containing protein